MGVNIAAIGRRYPADTYAVGREKIREYASAVGETLALYYDLDAARGAGHADLVAPPMFAAVYAGRAVAPCLFDPELGIDLGMLVHGYQRFRWEALVVAGDEISTVATVKDVAQRAGLGFYVFETTSENQRSEIVCVGLWTNIVRGTG
ncbi:MAG: MaoC family dehydratase N-terminal domain-containing protein [Solirubrobacteraceae bacterium]